MPGMVDIFAALRKQAGGFKLKASLDYAVS